MNPGVAMIIMATLPFAVVDKTAPDTAVRHISGKELNGMLQKGMTPQALFSQVILAKHDSYLIYMTTRDRNGQAEVHQSWNDNIFLQDGETSFIVGGKTVDARERDPGELRGSAISGGATIALHPGDYLFIPAGVPHQMVVKRGQRATFLDFKTHK